MPGTYAAEADLSAHLTAAERAAALAHLGHPDLEGHRLAASRELDARIGPPRPDGMPAAEAEGRRDAVARIVAARALEIIARSGDDALARRARILRDEHDGAVLRLRIRRGVGCRLIR